MLPLDEITSQLAKRRRKLRLTQAQLAEKVGISRTYLSMLERGEADNPSYEMIVRLQRFLAPETTERPEDRYTASCYMCGSYSDLEMLPHQKDGTIVGLIFSCHSCAPQLWGTEFIATFPEPVAEMGAT